MASGAERNRNADVGVPEHGEDRDYRNKLDWEDAELARKAKNRDRFKKLAAVDWHAYFMKPNKSRVFIQKAHTNNIMFLMGTILDVYYDPRSARLLGLKMRCPEAKATVSILRSVLPEFWVWLHGSQAEPFYRLYDLEGIEGLRRRTFLVIATDFGIRTQLKRLDCECGGQVGAQVQSLTIITADIREVVSIQTLLERKLSSANGEDQR